MEISTDPTKNPLGNTNFTCSICGLQQNIDQTVNINLKICVSCYNKQQVYENVEEQLYFYENHLKTIKDLSPIRIKKLKELRLLNGIATPFNFLSTTEEDLTSIINDARKMALLGGIQAVKDSYNIGAVNSDNIDSEMVNHIIDIWKYKNKIPTVKKEIAIQALSRIIPPEKLPKEQYESFFKAIRVGAQVKSFTQIDNNFQIVQIPLERVNLQELLKTIKQYRKLIERDTSQLVRFDHLLRFIAEKCQFQSKEDRIVFALRDYIKEFKNEKLEKLQEWMLSEINLQENAKLIPNIARFILDHADQIFYRWYTELFCFDKTHLIIQNAKAMSRTDFAVQIQYTYSKQELKLFKEILQVNTESLIKARYEERILKLQNDKILEPNLKIAKIETEKTRMTQDLLPENLKTAQDAEINNSSNIARFLILNTEKAFNLVLDYIIRYHYKRLEITTPVQFITNVSKSLVEDKRGALVVSYWISSREW